MLGNKRKILVRFHKSKPKNLRILLLRIKILKIRKRWINNKNKFKILFYNNLIWVFLINHNQKNLPIHNNNIKKLVSCKSLKKYPQIYYKTSFQVVCKHPNQHPNQFFLYKMSKLLLLNIHNKVLIMYKNNKTQLLLCLKVCPLRILMMRWKLNMIVLKF